MLRNYDLAAIRYSEIYEQVKNNFIGKECVIEYYKLSKYVARIEVIE